MSEETGIELLQRAAAARARILRVEAVAAAGDGRDAATARAYLLTFDVGRVLIAADAAHSRLALRFIEATAGLPMARTPLDEEEPWWRVAGNPITRVWPEDEDALRGLRLQFREDGENPKRIRMRIDGDRVRVSLEAAHGD